MTILDRYLGVRLIGVFCRTALALYALYVLFDLLTHRSSEIISNNVPWQTVAMLYASEIPYVFSEYQLAALAVLVSGLIVFGSAAQNNEITAMLSAGMSLRRIVVVPVLVAALIAAGVFALQEFAGVHAAKTSQSIVQRYFTDNPNAERPGISWPQLADGWKCHVLKFNRAALTGENVLLLRYTDAEIQRVQARRIFWEPDSQRWLIEDGLWSTFNPRDQMSATHRRVTQTVAPIPDGPEELFAIEANPATLRYDQMAANLRRARELGVPTARVEVDLHARFAKPFLAFVMIWLAAPFALRLRRGGIATAFGVSIAIGLTYLMTSVIVQGLGYIGRIPPEVAAWGPNAVFLAFGLLMFLRTPS